MDSVGKIIVTLVCCCVIFWGESASSDNIDTSLEYKSANCPVGLSYEYFQSSCYKVHTAKVSRDVASTFCIEDLSHLADITSQLEQDFIANLLDENPEIQWRRKYRNPKNVGAWIGLMVSGISEEFVWTDGAQLDFEAWDPVDGRNEPNTNCVRMDSRFDFQWGDRRCADHFSFVCERDPDMKASTPTGSLPHDVTETTAFHNTTGHSLNNQGNHDGIFAIEISYPFLTIAVAAVVGLVLYRVYLRKKTPNPVYDQPQFPIANNLNRTSNHGYIEITNGDSHSPQFPAPRTTQFILPPGAGNACAEDVRTSLQSNGYVEFKTESHPKQGVNTHHTPKLNNNVVHTYFEPNKHEFNLASPSKTVIKHTYFNPRACGRKTLTSGDVKDKAQEKTPRLSGHTF